MQLANQQFLVADEYSAGRMHREEEKAFVEAHREEETNGREEETVLMVRMEAVNTGTTPHYAFLTTINHSRPVWLQKNVSYDGSSGCGLTQEGWVFSVNRLNGRPMPQQEVAILLAPGEKAVVESAVPHQFPARERAVALAGLCWSSEPERCS